ncbi:MAG: hypothetical protein FH762_05710 [Firmicutes bacterium]|nr:hypothetical protein [Bacillota bacterium]
MGNEKNITHKELLTFSNLTNLDWHFVNLEKTITDTNGVSRKRSTKLNGLLTPDSFAREKTDPKTKRKKNVNIYGTDNQGNYLGKDEGLAEMRQHAGIAMEYLEKWQDEGKLLISSDRF